MITDNIDIVKSLLLFPEGIFYYLQVIQRKKDNPDLEQDRKRYQCYIASERDFNIHITRVKKVCEDYNARAYICLVPKSLEKFGKACLLEYTKRVCSGDYSRVWDLPNRVALDVDVRATGVFPKPRWMLDVDNPLWINRIEEFCKSKDINVVAKLKTPNGYHLIVEAFNPSKVTFRGEDLMISEDCWCTLRKDCNTVIYSVDNKSL